MAPASHGARKDSLRRGARIAAVVALAILAVPVLAASGVGAWALSSRLGDPMEALRRDPVEVRVVRDSAYPGETAAGEARRFRDLTVVTGDAGTIRVTTSRPVEAAPGSLPIVVILAGLRTGRESLDVVERHGPNLLVGYQYPYDQETWYRGARVTQLPVIRRAALDVPWQVSHLLERLAADPATDTSRTALLGYSFGALFVPAVQRLAAERSRPFDALILAFGGAGIEGLLDANLRVGPTPLRRGIAWAGASLLHPLEADHHLPHLAGRSLVIRGAADRQVPPELSARLAERIPGPKRVVTLEGGHMNPRDRELTQRVVRLSQEWLAEQGVIEE